MIPVRIAANLTPAGTDGVRWVLVDDAETASPAPAGEPPPQPRDDAHPRRRPALRWIRLAVLFAGLAGAAATSHCIAGDGDRPVPVGEIGSTGEPAAAA